MSAEWWDFRAEDCPACHGDGWTAETTADPDEDGQPGEPYQYQAACAHPLLWKPLLDERDAAIRRASLDPERLAAAMNAFERKADLSAFVETNLGTHRADCAHVGMIVAAYNEGAGTSSESNSIADPARPLASPKSGGSVDSRRD